MSTLKFGSLDCLSSLILAVTFLLCALSSVHATKGNVEDVYNDHFGNVSYYRCWKQAKDWYVEDFEPMLKKLCAEAHKVSGKGSYPVDWLWWRERTLQFKNPAYLARRVDVVEYTVEQNGPITPPPDLFLFWQGKLENEENKWAIAEGRRPDCVYYLNLDSVNGSTRVYSLKEEVCGIRVEEEVRAPLPSIDEIVV